MEKVENIIAPNGKLWSELRKKKPETSRVKRGKTSQQKRRAETLKWRAERKRQLWDEGFSCLKELAGMWRSGRCGLCGLLIRDFYDCESDHKIPVRRGGDCDSNTHLTHRLGNRAKGSVSLEAYLAKYSLAERQAICKGEPCPKRERP